MKVIVIDAANLAGEGNFPKLNMKQYSWEQYPTLADEDIATVVWRCDVIVAAADAVDRAMLDLAFKISLIVAAGDSTDHIDKVAAAERGIKICNVPGRDPANQEDVKRICREVVSAINAFTKGQDYNRVA